MRTRIAAVLPILSLLLIGWFVPFQYVRSVAYTLFQDPRWESLFEERLEAQAATDGWEALYPMEAEESMIYIYTVLLLLSAFSYLFIKKFNWAVITLVLNCLILGWTPFLYNSADQSFEFLVSFEIEIGPSVYFMMASGLLFCALSGFRYYSLWKHQKAP